MKTVTVSASKDYNILIGPGLLSQLGSRVKDLGNIQKVALVSESTVYPLFGAKAESSLKEAGLEVVTFVFHAGEQSIKSENYLNL